MSVRREEFALGDEARLDLSVKSGNVTVQTLAGSTATVTIEGGDVDDWEINQLGSSLSVQPPRGRLWGGRSARVHVELPEGADATISTASADVSVVGVLGAARIRTASGNVRLLDASRVDANSASGDVRVESIAGDASCTTASGDVEVTSVVGRLTVNTASGDVRIGGAGDDAQLGTASGDIRIDRYDGSDLTVKSISGDVTLGLPAGIRVEPDLSTLSGRTRLPERSTAAADADGERRMVRVRIKTVSGDIAINRV